MKSTGARGFANCLRIPGIYTACVFALFFYCALPTYSAGGVGHYYIAKASAERLMQTPDVPKAFKEALKDPSCLNAFCNGAIAPDMSCIVERSHYGRTTDLPLKMLDIAEVAYMNARNLPDSDPAKADRMKEAMKAVAFTCGWMSHCAADVAVHPKVNSRAGDAWEFCDTGKKGVHMAAEIHLTRYLVATFRKPTDQITFDIPYWLVSKAASVTEKELQDSVKEMRIKLKGEMVAAMAVTIPLADLRKEWHDPCQKAINDTVLYISDPDAFKDYGLDYGPIGTTEFRELRKECVGINDGKVPAQWGREYMNWWNIVKAMNSSARHQKLIELIKGRQPVNSRQIIIEPGGSIEAEFYVNGIKLPQHKKTALNMPSNGILRVQVSAITGSKWRCRRTSEYTGSNVNILEQTPYSLHYTSTSQSKPYEYNLSLISETYTWKTAYTWNTRYGAGTGKAYSGGRHPKVKDDVFEWKLPQIDKIQGGKEILNLFITADLDWNLSTTREGKQTRQERNIGLGLKVEVPTE